MDAIKNKSNTFILVGLLGILFGFIIVNISWKSDFSKTYTGYYIESNKINLGEKSELKLKGQISKSIIGFKSFSGTLEFNSKIKNVAFYKKEGSRSHIYILEENGKSTPFGNIYFENINEEIIVGFSEEKNGTWMFDFEEQPLFVSIDHPNEVKIRNIINKYNTVH